LQSKLSLICCTPAFLSQRPCKQFRPSDLGQQCLPSLPCVLIASLCTVPQALVSLGQHSCVLASMSCLSLACEHSPNFDCCSHKKLCVLCIHLPGGWHQNRHGSCSIVRCVTAAPVSKQCNTGMVLCITGKQCNTETVYLALQVCSAV